jgi:hypothetical protein
MEERQATEQILLSQSIPSWKGAETGDAPLVFGKKRLTPLGEVVNDAM